VFRDVPSYAIERNAKRCNNPDSPFQEYPVTFFILSFTILHYSSRRAALSLSKEGSAGCVGPALAAKKPASQVILK
jgi:hypothetical protein